MTSLGNKGKGASVNGARSRHPGLFQHFLLYTYLHNVNFFTAEIPMSQPGHQNPTQPEMTMKVY